jgi:hypothetical protein
MKTHGGVSGQLYAPATLIPGQTPGYRLNRRLGVSRGQSGHFWDGNIFCTDRSHSVSYVP